MSDPMPAKNTSHDFIVRLDGLQLDETARSRIAGAVQGAVMSELGQLDLAARKRLGGLAFIPHQWWWGFWLRETAHLPQDLKDVEKGFQVVERG
jgi:hypothetical protein